MEAVGKSSDYKLAKHNATSNLEDEGECFFVVSVERWEDLAPHHLLKAQCSSFTSISNHFWVTIKYLTMIVSSSNG
jgi:hypothetical protein